MDKKYYYILKHEGMLKEEEYIIETTLTPKMLNKYLVAIAFRFKDLIKYVAPWAYYWCLENDIHQLFGHDTFRIASLQEGIRARTIDLNSIENEANSDMEYVDFLLGYIDDLVHILREEDYTSIKVWDNIFDKVCSIYTREE